MELILDIGSGMSIPDLYTGKKIIDSVAARDKHKHKIIFKTQLFKDIPPNKPLSFEMFHFLFDYASESGYKLTASVFDEESLAFLLTFPIPFVKIAAPPQYRYLVGKVPREITVYASNYSGRDGNLRSLACIPKYPATLEEYMQIPWIAYYDGVSDHTVGWELMALLQPDILEKHYCLEHTEGNPDAGEFAITPSELKEVIG